MMRSDFVKRSVLRSVTAVITPVHRFHSTSKTLSRSVLCKKRRNVSEEKHVQTRVDPLAANESLNVNFLGIESEEGVITVNSTANSVQRNTLKRNLREKFCRTSFGIIRNDCDNTLKFHGQYGSTYDYVFPRTSDDYSSVVSVDPATASSSKTCNNVEVDELNYSVKNPKVSKGNKHTHINVDVSNKKSSDLHALDNDDKGTSYIDQYYFNDSCTDEREHSVQNVSATQISPEELNFIDNNYFGDTAVSESQKSSQKHISPNPYLGKEVDAEYSKSFSENLKSNYIDDEKLNSTQNNTEVSAKCNEGDIFQDTFYNVNTIDTSDRKHMDIVKDIFYNVNMIDTSDRKHMDIVNSSKNIKIKQFNYEVKDVNVKSDADSVDLGVNFLHNANCLQPEDSTKHNTKFNISSSEKVISGNHLSRTIEPFPSKIGSKHQKLYSEESVDVDDARAVDFVKNLQKQKEEEYSIKRENGALDIKVDTKGFRILKNQVKDLSNFTRDEIINLLKQNILYSDDNIVILDKPYSLVMHESKTTRSPCLSAFLDELANELHGQGNDSKLYTVHRLDKETTGCLLLARNELMAQNLKSLFAQRKIIKKYWILTSRVPDPPEGIIDIPVAEGSVDNKKRMVLHPEIPKDINYHNHSKRGKPAVTSYKVLSESGNAALVEATPLTGIKHQIRVHFGFGLCCPILGDHKYSHLDKLAPQKLPSDILQRLHVRQSKVRYIPLHIHAKSVTIPGYFEGRDLYVKAPLPSHMKENLKRLKFKK